MRINEDFLDDEQQVIQQTTDVSAEENRSAEFYFLLELYPDKESIGNKVLKRALYVMNVFRGIEVVESRFEPSCCVGLISFNTNPRFTRPKRCFEFLHRVICSVQRSVAIFGFAVESPKYAIRNSISALVPFFTQDTYMLSDGFEKAYGWIKNVMCDLMGEVWLARMIGKEILLDSGEMKLLSDNICQSYSYSNEKVYGSKLDELEGHLLDLDILDRLAERKDISYHIIAVSDREIPMVHFRGNNAMAASEDYRKELIRDIYRPNVMAPAFLCSGTGSPQQRKYTFVCYIGSVSTKFEKRSGTHVFLVLESTYVSHSEKNPDRRDRFIKAMKYMLQGELDAAVVRKIEWAGRTR